MHCRDILTERMVITQNKMWHRVSDATFYLRLISRGWTAIRSMRRPLAGGEFGLLAAGQPPEVAAVLPDGYRAGENRKNTAGQADVVQQKLKSDGEYGKQYGNGDGTNRHGAGKRKHRKKDHDQADGDAPVDEKRHDSADRNALSAAKPEEDRPAMAYHAGGACQRKACFAAKP